MSYGYGGRQNPYDQRGGAPAQGGYGGQEPYGGAPPPQQQQSYGRQYNAPQQSYGRQYDAPPAMGRDEYAGQNVEMEPLNGSGGQYGRANDPNAILNECGSISEGIKGIENAISRLRTTQQRVLSNPDANSSESQEMNALDAEIMNMFRNFTGRVKTLKQKPESGSPRNAPQIGNTERRLKGVRQAYLDADVSFQRQLKEQMGRQYRIVRPEASDEEVREAVEDTSNQNVFSQAMMQSNRRGQAQSALNAVQSRHEAIAKIERQMIELAELFQDMENLVVQQEAAVTNIEMKGEEVVENMDKGTEQIGVAIKSARNARKWKWWCLGICVLIIIIIVVVVLIYKFVIQNNNTSKPAAKRFVLTDIIAERGIPGLSFHESIVKTGEYTEEVGTKMVRAARRFAA